MSRDPITLRLPCRTPFDGAALIEYLRARAVAGVEEVDDGVYRRSVRLPHGIGVIELAPGEDHVRGRYVLADERDVADAVQRSRWLLDLDCDPEPVAAALRTDTVLGRLVRLSPGRRVPGHVDAHEIAVRAVLGQQVSLAAAAKIASRIVLACGEALAGPIGGITHAFPSAEAIAALAPERLPMPAARRNALAGLCRALASGELVLDPDVDRVEARRRLIELPGIGPWTAEYVAMRALRDPDAFLPTDLGVRKALERLGRDGRPVAAAALAEQWRPYRAYALQHLWASLALPRALTGTQAIRKVAP